MPARSHQPSATALCCSMFRQWWGHGLAGGRRRLLCMTPKHCCLVVLLGGVGLELTVPCILCLTDTALDYTSGDAGGQPGLPHRRPRAQAPGAAARPLELRQEVRGSKRAVGGGKGGERRVKRQEVRQTHVHLRCPPAHASTMHHRLNALTASDQFLTFSPPLPPFLHRPGGPLPPLCVPPHCSHPG